MRLRYFGLLLRALLFEILLFFVKYLVLGHKNYCCCYYFLRLPGWSCIWYIPECKGLHTLLNHQLVKSCWKNSEYNDGDGWCLISISIFSQGVENEEGAFACIDYKYWKIIRWKFFKWTPRSGKLSVFRLQNYCMIYKD